MTVAELEERLKRLRLDGYGKREVEYLEITDYNIPHPISAVIIENSETVSLI